MKWTREDRVPCDWCPYRLGLIQTLVNPCPQCRQENYQMIERFLRKTGGRYPGGLPVDEGGSENG